MSNFPDVTFDEHELLMVEAAALAIGVCQNEDNSLTMTIKQLMLLCTIAAQVAIEEME